MTSSPQDALRQFKPKHKFFVGIDSDGCVFDSMELKHKECFIPAIIKCWKLQAVSKYAREAAEFVNLYSKWRGCNRFPGLEMVFALLKERPEVQRRGAKIPDIPELAEFINSGVALGNPALIKAVEQTQNPNLIRLLEWSNAVNAAIADMVEGVPPFPLVRETLVKLQDKADVIVVSATPGEALQREWIENDLARYVAIIAGQEMGKKKEHLQLTTGNRYEKQRILMLGDAPGDLKAAKDNQALFFPINPGHEEESWERFYNEGMTVFFEERYAGDYEARLIADFQKLLPDRPPWK